jgi:HK97 family phage portal protein
MLYPVFGAARLLADSIASMPPVLYTNGSDGVPAALSTPSLFVQPSVNGTLYDWLHRAVISMALHGDAVGHVTQRNYYGFPTMAEWLNPMEVAVHDHALQGPGSFVNPLWYWRGRPLNREDIIHVPWFTMPYKVRGHSPIAAFQLTANIGLGAQEMHSAWFHNGGVPPGVLKNSQQKVAKEDADLLAQRVTNRFQQRKPLVIGMDWDYTPIQIKPNEAAFIETAQLTATQIAVMYGIPPEMIGGQAGGNLTYNTVQMNALNFLTFCLRPWLVRIESALSNLFPRGQFVRFDTTELLRTDPLTKAQIDQLSLGYYPPAYKTIGEVRQSNFLPRVDADQLPPMYRPGGGAVPGEPENPAAPSQPLTYLNGNGQHPVATGAN